MIKLMIVDDIDHIRDYFDMILSQEEDMNVVGLASSGEEAYKKALKYKPDIILMDIQMETDEAGIEAIHRIKAKMPKIKFIILTIHQEDELLFKAYTAGAMDYIIKTDSIVDIITSIRRVYHNKLQLRPNIANKIIKEFSRLRNEQKTLINTLNIISKLTNAEYEVLRAVYEGKNYKDIAKERFVEYVTIRTQVNKILKKFKESKIKDVVKLLKKHKVFEIYDDEL